MTSASVQSACRVFFSCIKGLAISPSTAIMENVCLFHETYQAHSDPNTSPKITGPASTPFTLSLITQCSRAAILCNVRVQQCLSDCIVCVEMCTSPGCMSKTMLNNVPVRVHSVLASIYISHRTFMIYIYTYICDIITHEDLYTASHFY